MTIDELNAKYGKPATVVNNTTNNNPFGWTTTPEASKPDNIRRVTETTANYS